MKVGDRVRVVKENYNRVGIREIGTVVEVSEGIIEVEPDSGAYLDVGDGMPATWWPFSPNDLEVIEE